MSTCSHCAETFDGDAVPTHDFPKPCRVICKGAGKPSRTFAELLGYEPAGKHKILHVHAIGNYPMRMAMFLGTSIAVGASEKAPVTSNDYKALMRAFLGRPAGHSSPLALLEYIDGVMPDIRHERGAFTARFLWIEDVDPAVFARFLDKQVAPALRVTGYFVEAVKPRDHQ